jgi:hypothetical protein
MNTPYRVSAKQKAELRRAKLAYDKAQAAFNATKSMSTVHEHAQAYDPFTSTPPTTCTQKLHDDALRIMLDARSEYEKVRLSLVSTARRTLEVA